MGLTASDSPDGTFLAMLVGQITRRYEVTIGNHEALCTTISKRFGWLE